MTFGTRYMRLHLIAPVSVGCDEVYEPMSFVVDEEAGELISFDTFAFLASLDQKARTEFGKICKKGSLESLLELLRFMRKHRGKAQGQRSRLAAGFVQHYQQVLGLPRNSRTITQNLNKFQIGRTAFNHHTGLPVIPGSAIKGALRTAVLNLRNNGQSQPTFRGKTANRDLQEHLLDYSMNRNNLHRDPFRLVKVSDFRPCAPCSRKVLYAVNLKKRATCDDSKGPPQILEAVEPGASFIGTISLLEPSARAGISKAVTWDELRQACAAFFSRENQRENRDLAAMGCKTRQLDQEQEGIPLRMGRHSGAECVTVRGRREIKVSPPGVKPPRHAASATTLWLASEYRQPKTYHTLLPFGWSILHPLDEEKGRELLDQAGIIENKALEQVRQLAKTQRQAAKERLRRKQEEEERKRKAEEKAKQDKERQEALREQWQNLSSKEQDLAIIRQDELARACASDTDPLRDIWPKLESAEPEHQQALALAFKQAWQRTGNWDVKKSRKKQLARVEKIKKILSAAGEDAPGSGPTSTSALVTEIKSLPGWDAYCQLNISIAELNLEEAKALKDKFKKWGCHDKRAKKNKKQAWKALLGHLSKLQDS